MKGRNVVQLPAVHVNLKHGARGAVFRDIVFSVLINLPSATITQLKEPYCILRSSHHCHRITEVRIL